MLGKVLSETKMKNLGSPSGVWTTLQGLPSTSDNSHPFFQAADTAVAAACELIPQSKVSDKMQNVPKKFAHSKVGSVGS